LKLFVHFADDISLNEICCLSFSMSQKNSIFLLQKQKMILTKEKDK